MKTSGKQIEESGIAVLLMGDSSDLSASLHAVELAKRTGKVVHAVFIGKSGVDAKCVVDNRTHDPVILAAWLGQAEELPIRWHTLTDATDEALIGFFRTHRIFCLISGAESRKAKLRKTRWLEEMRGRLFNDAHWYTRAFWVLVTEPWDNKRFERVIRQLSSRELGAAEMV